MKQIYMRVHLYRLREACLQDAIKRVTQANKAPGFARVGRNVYRMQSHPFFTKMFLPYLQEAIYSVIL